MSVNYKLPYFPLSVLMCPPRFLDAELNNDIATRTSNNYSGQGLNRTMSKTMDAIIIIFSLLYLRVVFLKLVNYLGFRVELQSVMCECFCT